MEFVELQKRLCGLITEKSTDADYLRYEDSRFVVIDFGKYKVILDGEGLDEDGRMDMVHSEWDILTNKVYATFLRGVTGRLGGHVYYAETVLND